MEYWARLLQRQFGLSWVEADFLGAGATCDSLRAIAAHFGESVRERAEAIIAAQAPAARAVEEGSRARLEGRLYFSFAPLQPRDVRAFKALGVRVGSSLQGWPDREGHWRMPRVRRRAQELTWAEVRALLDEAQPDVVDGLGDWC
jgi:nitrogenase molybdenum-iron protein alpha chain